MISYGGIHLLARPPAGLALPPMEAFEFFRPKLLANPSFNPRPHFNWWLRRGIRIATFHNPWGAARWGSAFVMVNQTALDEIRALAYGEAGDEYNDLPFVLSDSAGELTGQTTSEITTNLWMLPAVPMAAARLVFTNTVVDPGEQVYLLPLVDDRYFWWEIATEIDVAEGTTTWNQLYDAFASALGITLNRDAIPAAYKKPANGLTKHYEHLPLIMDLAAASVGQRIVRRLDGTFHAINPATAAALVTAQKADLIKLAGGDLPAEDVNADLPENFSVTFPRANYQGITTSIRMNSGIHVENHHKVTVAGGGLAGTKNLHSTAIANFEGGASPQNDTELDALAAQMAADWEAWRTGLLEVLYRTVATWEAEGMHDVEWLFAGTLATAVHRSVWEPEQGQYQHAGEFGSSAEPPISGAQVVGIVNGTLVNGVFDAVLMLRDHAAKTDVANDPVWIYDLYGAAALAAGDSYNGVYRGIEPHGWYYVAIASSTGAGLGDDTKWIQLGAAVDPTAILPYVAPIVTAVDLAEGFQSINAGSEPTDFASTLDVAIVDDDFSVTVGQVQIIGTDAAGGPLDETIDFSGGGSATYTTVGVFKTLTSIEVLPGLTGAAAGDTIAVSATLYPVGVLRTDGGDTWIVTTATNTAPADPDWTILPSGLTDAGGYRVARAYTAGDYVQEVRALYAVQAGEGGGTMTTLSVVTSVTCEGGVLTVVNEDVIVRVV